MVLGLDVTGKTNIFTLAGIRQDLLPSATLPAMEVSLTVNTAGLSTQAAFHRSKMDEVVGDILDGCDICGENHATEECAELFVGECEPPVLSRARLTLPHFLAVLDRDDGTTSVVAKEPIAAKTRLGPYEAKVTSPVSEDCETDFVLKVFSKGHPVQTLDASSENECNWMCLVRVAVSSEEQNCMLLQIGRDLFYSTTRVVGAGEELCVWYAPHYATKLRKSSSPDGLSRSLLQRKLETTENVLPPLTLEPKMEEEEEKEVVEAGQEEEDPCEMAVGSFWVLDLVDLKEILEISISDLAAGSHEFVRMEDADPVGVVGGPMNTSEQLLHQALCTAPRDLHIVHKASSVGMRSCSRCQAQFGTLKELALHIKQHLVEESKTKIKDENKREEEKIKEETGEEETRKEKKEGGVTRSGRSVQKKFSVCEVLGIKKEMDAGKKKRRKNRNAIKVLTEVDADMLAGHFKVVSADTMPECRVMCQRLSEAQLEKYASQGQPPPDDSYISPKKVTPEVTSEVTSAPQEAPPDASADEGTEEELGSPSPVEPEIKKEAKPSRVSKEKKKKEKRREEDDLIFKCEHCDKAFTNLKGLRSHEKGHDFPFRCDKCQLQFMKKISMQRHNCQPTEEFFCEFCGAKFKDKSYLLRHMAGHTGEFACEKCGRTFARKESLLSHLHLCDPDALERRGFAKFFCQLCKKAFGRASTLQNHMALHERKYVCDQCGKAFSTSLSQLKHVCPGVSILKQDKKVLCDFCPKTFVSEVALQQHMNKHVGSMSCVLCSKSYSSKQEFLKHLVTCACSQEGGDYKCSVCAALFSTEADFRLHYKEHSHPYSCDTCGKRFVRKCNLQLHTCKTQQPLSCSVCNKTFGHRSALLTHATSHEEKTLRCEFCSKRFSREKALNRHFCRNPNDGTPMTMVRTPDGQVRFYASKQSLVCPVCGKSASSVSNLNMHVKRHGEKKEACDVCGKCFLTPAMLQKHKASVHVAGQKRFACVECGKTYKSELSLHSHKRVYHNASIETHECPTCNKKFMHKGNLRKHLLVHNDKKQFGCTLCGKAFRQREQLHHHELWHEHGLRCKCSMCDKAFVTEAELIRHAQSAHGGITYSCRYCNTDCHFTNTMKRHLARHHADILEWQEDPAAYVKALAKQDPSVLQRLRLDSKEGMVQLKQEEQALQDSSSDMAALGHINMDPNDSLEGLSLMHEGGEGVYSGGPVIVAEVHGEGEGGSSQTLIIQTEGEGTGKITSEEVAEAMRSLNFSSMEQTEYASEQHVILPPGGLESDVLPMEVVMGDGSVVFVPMVSEEAQVITAADGSCQGTAAYMQLQPLP
ncbi:hypothetical protein CAPTEDRAFT_225157 [Capitella teleta]|uniref:Uncharacterized protein n=1 Tax=Capitella teleta TaxID=283909 RepID=R7U211_CAPTE|nr:hypothetical protein CAPTEDRAFT_225157 [Capitella teleta]|eukprot:ELT99902.1 hypothetical protein CAPTEDRAFT_225157 [Capitella teleta]